MVYSGSHAKAGALTASEMSVLERMPPARLRNKAPRVAPATPCKGAKLRAVHVPALEMTDSASSGCAARPRSVQETHNELVLASRLSPRHPALLACWLLKQVGQGAFSKVYLARPRGADDGCRFVLKVVDLGRDCKLRADYKHILRAEGAWLHKFAQPGFVKCHGSWGASTPAG